MFDMLMGEKVEPRREFIQENAQYVADLDIIVKERKNGRTWN